jgi:hypothetical protein
MTYHVFITTPRAGLGFAVAPYTVEAKEVFATRELAQAFADAKVLSPGVVALFDAMPPVHPAWAAGQAVTAGTYRAYQGKTYRAIQGHTTQAGWEPPNVPALWHLVENPGIAAWLAGVAYALPATRTYAGRAYELLQPHTSQVGWEPPAVPALWKDVGSALAVPAYTRAQWNVVSSDDPDYTEVIRAKEV